VFTDLSIIAAREARAVFKASDLWNNYRDRIEFHAVDAMHLPFPDETFDIIYGVKFVGFINDHAQLFAEVMRCLKADGRCRFADDALAPAWESAKAALRHVSRALHRTRMRSSLQQVRAASTSAVSEQDVKLFKDRFGFRNYVFIREFFFLRIAQLCIAKLSGWGRKSRKRNRYLFLVMKWIDLKLGNCNWISRNQLALTWGFDK
jgi:SAM-dependent methyltransferase